MLSLESDHYRHLPQMYHADPIRDMDTRPNVNSLDLAASPPPTSSSASSSFGSSASSRQAARHSQPLTPPITPARRVQPSSRPLPRFIPILSQHDDSISTNPSSPRPSSPLFLKVQQGSTLPTRYLVVTGLPPKLPAEELTPVFSVSLPPLFPFSVPPELSSSPPTASRRSQGHLCSLPAKIWRRHTIIPRPPPCYSRL